MCPGTATKLLCSHYLVHWSGPRCPKHCVLPARRAALACTCAACDPGHNQRQVLRRHAAAREALLARIRTALREGRPAHEVRRMERELRVLAAAQMEDLGRAARVAPGLDPAVGCRWPGLYEQWVANNLGREVDWDSLLSP